MNKVKLLLVAFLALLPVLANASELHDEFINRCLFPLGEGEPFVTEGLLGPFSAPDEDIGVQGAAAVRKSWQFPNNNWVFGTIEAGSANFVIARALWNNCRQISRITKLGYCKDHELAWTAH